MKISLEQKLLYNVLLEINRDGRVKSTLGDHNYLDSLESIGLITSDWDLHLTEFGKIIFEFLKSIMWNK